MSIPGAGSPLFLSAAAAEAAAFQISRSIRINDDDTAYLDRTPSSASNRKTWTWSAWVKRSKLSAEANLFSVGASSTDAAFRFNADDTLQVRDGGGGELTTNAVFRDPGAWSHIVVSLDNTQSTDTDRFKVYVNGVEQTYSASSYASQNTDGDFNTAVAHYIGRQVHNTSNLFDGYLAEIHFVDGTQLAASDFGQYDSHNVWQPKDCQSSLTYGTNGFYLKFADNSSNASLGTDSSGNSNTWTINNITANSSALQSQTWSSNFTTTGNSGNWSTNSSFAVTNAFNGNDSNYAHGNPDGSVAVAVTLSISPAIPCNSTVTFLGGVTSNGSGTIAINGGTATAFTTVGVNPTASNTATVSFSGDITSIVVTKTSTSANGLLIYGFEVDGVRLVDSGVAYAAAKDTDSVIDTPTNYTPDSGNPGGNYATFSPIDSHSSNTFANGNLEATNAGVNVFANLTMGFTSGKWYCEIEADGGGSGSCMVGVCNLNETHANRKYGAAGGLYMYQGTGGLYSGGLGGSFSNGSYASAFSDGDIIGIGLDMDNGNVRFYVNGSDKGQANTSSLAGALVSPAVNNDTNSASFKLNTGQRPFAYTVPTNHKAMCTANFADPTIADGSTAFDVITATGTGAERTFTMTGGFGPDLVWSKSRSNAYNHGLFDTVRGGTKRLRSNGSNAEDTSANQVKSFTSNGFVQGGDVPNTSGETGVYWAWDAGTSTASNTDGSITSNVRANTSAGFSIAGYTGTGTAGTIGHGLNAAPEFIIVKNRDTGRPWSVFHQSITGMSSGYLNLNLANSFTGSYTGVWNGTDPTSSVFSVGTDNESNNSGDDFIAYCWTSVSQYSSFGIYTGNGASDGPFVFLGFRPRFLLYKRTDAADTVGWILTDSERNTYNVIDDYLSPTTASAEGTTDIVDFLSNGFKMRIAGADGNVSGGTYVYAAFAEHPFATARAR